MKDNSKGPKTLLEAIKYFADEDTCVKTLSALRWPDGVIGCPSCGNSEHYYLAKRRVWKCKACSRQFSIKVGTIFEDSPISLTKWLPCMWMICGAKNGISSYEVHRALGVTQKTAWFMLHRIRLAMQAGDFGQLNGEVEADETFVGGKAKNQHKWQRKGKGRGSKGKAAVHGMIERGGKVVATTVPNLEGPTLRGNIERYVAPTATIYTDEFKAYALLNRTFDHHIVDHTIEYVNERVHTNTMENFWSLLKRGLRGTYISVEPFHLFRYVDEQVFRFNERKDTDAGRFAKALTQVSGKRVTYNELTGKTRGA